jgi:hypothetical protein
VRRAANGQISDPHGVVSPAAEKLLWLVEHLPGVQLLLAAWEERDLVKVKGEIAKLIEEANAALDAAEEEGAGRLTSEDFAWPSNQRPLLVFFGPDGLPRVIRGPVRDIETLLPLRADLAAEFAERLIAWADSQD